MKRNFIDIKYFETYYFANVIKNVLDDPFAYLRTLDEFFGENNQMSFIEPFPKVSRLHEFIAWSIDTISYEDMGEIGKLKNGSKLWIDIAINHYQIDNDNFQTYLTSIGKNLETAKDDDIYEYYQDLRLTQIYDTLLTKMSDEIFFILFLNRQLLQNFNKMASTPIADYCLDFGDQEINKHFAKDGVLKRVGIPSWVQKAVFHRDRGICTKCFKDITGLINIGNTENFDHIVSLADGGLNDVTNIQLLCETCNKSKGKRQVLSSSYYEKWF